MSHWRVAAKRSLLTAYKSQLPVTAVPRSFVTSLMWSRWTTWNDNQCSNVPYFWDNWTTALCIVLLKYMSVYTLFSSINYKKQCKLNENCFSQLQNTFLLLIRQKLKHFHCMLRKESNAVKLVRTVSTLRNCKLSIRLLRFIRIMGCFSSRGR